MLDKSFIYKNKFIQFTIFRMPTHLYSEKCQEGVNSCSCLLDISGYSIFFRNSVAKQAKLGIPVAVK